MPGLGQYWFEQASPDIFKQKRFVKQAKILLAQVHTKNTRPITDRSLRLAALHTHMFVAWERHKAELTDRSRLVGMVNLSAHYETDGPVGMVNEMVTLDGHRRNGIARELMTRLIRVAKYTGLVELELTSNSSRKEAHKLYKSLGFKIRKTNVFNLQLD